MKCYLQQSRGALSENTFFLWQMRFVKLALFKNPFWDELQKLFVIIFAFINTETSLHVRHKKCFFMLSTKPRLEQVLSTKVMIGEYKAKIQTVRFLYYRHMWEACPIVYTSKVVPTQICSKNQRGSVILTLHWNWSHILFFNYILTFSVLACVVSSGYKCYGNIKIPN